MSEERGEWLVPGMLRDKVLALLKSLHQSPRGWCRCPDRRQPRPGAGLWQGSLVEALLKGRAPAHAAGHQARNDFKLDMLSPHLFMNYRVVDEHGRQLGMGRNLSPEGGVGRQGAPCLPGAGALKSPDGAAEASAPSRPAKPARIHAHAPVVQVAAAASKQPAQADTGPFTDWTFGELPELMEIRKGAHPDRLPGLIDRKTHVDIEVFDEPDVAAGQAPGRPSPPDRLAAERAAEVPGKNIPDLQKMAVLYMAWAPASSCATR